MPPILGIGLSTGLSHKEHVKGVAAEPSSPESPMAIGARHQSNEVSTVVTRLDKASAPEGPMPCWSIALDLLIATASTIRPQTATIQA